VEESRRIHVPPLLFVHWTRSFEEQANEWKQLFASSITCVHLAVEERRVIDLEMAVMEQAAADRNGNQNVSTSEEEENIGLKDLPPNSFVRRYSYGNMGGVAAEYQGI
jgi:hypothetical protein